MKKTSRREIRKQKQGRSKAEARQNQVRRKAEARQKLI
jgi:hypothetical protein